MLLTRSIHRTVRSSTLYLYTAIALSLMLSGCSPEPTAVRVPGLPSETHEGAEGSLNATVLDYEGTAIDGMDIAWSVDPPDSVAISGKTIRFTKEGQVKVTAKADNYAQTFEVAVRSPLSGVWGPVAHPLSGMQVRFQSRGEEFVGTVEIPPDADQATAESYWQSFWQNAPEAYRAQVEALPRAALFKRMIEIGMKREVECDKGAFSSGIIAARSIERLGNTTWKAEMLRRPVANQRKPNIYNPVFWCEPAGKFSERTLELLPDGTLSIREVAPDETQEVSDVVRSRNNLIWKRIK